MKSIIQQQKRRKEIYLALHPETKQGGDRKSEDAKSKRSEFGLIPSFSENAAKRLGVHPRTVEVAVQIASDIEEDVKQDALREISRLPVEQQRDIADKDNGIFRALL